MSDVIMYGMLGWNGVVRLQTDSGRPALVIVILSSHPVRWSPGCDGCIYSCEHGTCKLVNDFLDRKRGGGMSGVIEPLIRAARGFDDTWAARGNRN